MLKMTKHSKNEVVSPKEEKEDEEEHQFVTIPMYGY
jgi:hypothetical protein